jgi:hypothetical protein
MSTLRPPAWPVGRRQALDRKSATTSGNSMLRDFLALQVRIKEAATRRPKYAPLLRDFIDLKHIVDLEGRRECLGELAPIDDLIEIWKDAHRCQAHGHSESQWNTVVHAPLLKAALRYAAVNEDGAAEKLSDAEIGFQNVYVRPYPPSPSLPVS